jgi:hypothetical protein
VFKFEHPVFFHIASSTITPHLTVGLSRPSEERLNSYWVQVLENNNHYFFQRDFSWSLSHPRLRQETWKSLSAGLRRPTKFFNQTFHRVDSLCQEALTSCDVVIDANSGQVIRGSVERQSSSLPNAPYAELLRARGDFEAQVNSREKNLSSKSTISAYMAPSVRNYVRFSGTVARAVMDQIAKSYSSYAR